MDKLEFLKKKKTLQTTANKIELAFYSTKKYLQK